jgi:hypothetical protein
MAEIGQKERVGLVTKCVKQAASSNTSFAILNAGGRDDPGDQQSQRIDQKVPLATVHLRAGIVATLAEFLAVAR